jgi:Tfp pilus assembly protein PilF
MHYAAHAVKLDNTDTEIHAILAATYILIGEHARADFHSQRAVELNPNDANVLNERGLALTFLGQFSAAKTSRQIASAGPRGRGKGPGAGGAGARSTARPGALGNDPPG